jgi:hypothetical protein
MKGVRQVRKIPESIFEMKKCNKLNIFRKSEKSQHFRTLVNLANLTKLLHVLRTLVNSYFFTTIMQCFSLKNTKFTLMEIFFSQRKCIEMKYMYYSSKGFGTHACFFKSNFFFLINFESKWLFKDQSNFIKYIHPQSHDQSRNGTMPHRKGCKYHSRSSIPTS